MSTAKKNVRRDLKESLHAISPEELHRLEFGIGEIPGDAWHKFSAYGTYLDAGYRMLQHGMAMDEVLTTLQLVYWTTAECFGAG